MATLSLTQALTSALQFLGILDSGGAPSTQQLADGLIAFNDLIDSKSADRLFADAVSLTSQALVSGTQSYTITRVANIEAAALKMTNGPTLPLKILSAVEWTNQEDRDSTSYLVKGLFYDRNLTTPKMYLTPIPLGGSVEYVAWTAMTQFADATTAITMHPAYARWLKLQGALEIASQYTGSQITQGLLQNVADAAATLRILNASLLGIDPPSGQIAANVINPQTALPGVQKVA